MNTTTQTMKFEVTFNVFANSPCFGRYCGEAEVFGKTITSVEDCKSEKEVVAALKFQLKEMGV